MISQGLSNIYLKAGLLVCCHGNDGNFYNLVGAMS